MEWDTLSDSCSSDSKIFDPGRGDLEVNPGL